MPLILIFSTSFSTTPWALSLLPRVAGPNGARRRCGPLLLAAKRVVGCWSLLQPGPSLPAAKRDRVRGACWYERDRASGAPRARGAPDAARSRPAPRRDSAGDAGSRCFLAGSPWDFRRRFGGPSEVATGGLALIGAGTTTTNAADDTTIATGCCILL
jgi:hypothetical protein